MTGYDLSAAARIIGDAIRDSAKILANAYIEGEKIKAAK